MRGFDIWRNTCLSSRREGQVSDAPIIFSVVLLVGTSVFLGGCPKKTSLPVNSGSDGGRPAGAADRVVATDSSGLVGSFTLAVGQPDPGPGVIGATGVTFPAQPSPAEFQETSSLGDAHFAFDRYDIQPGDKPILERNAKWLKAHEAATLLIEGHCDERGTSDYNLALGERRAKATRDYLVSLGIDGARITMISFGEERPLCTERTQDCWARNRRSHFLVKQ